MSEPAPLVSTPDAPVPPGGEAEWIKGAGGARLRAALFAPPGRARGSIVLSGGRTEPIEKYYEFIGECLERGFVVLAHDWRGQGLSARELPDRMKGHARGYKTFLADLQILLGAFEARLPRPWVAVGHSMGGCLTLLAMAHGERRFAGAILSAPMLGVNTGKVRPAQARLAARLSGLLGRAHRYLPGQSARPAEEFETTVLTHDRARFARTQGLIAAEPQLALGAPTWGWLDFALRACAYLARPDRLREITAPVVIVQAEDDKLVDNTAQAAAARCLPQGKLIRIPGAYHEILMETDPMRNIFMRALDALLGRAAPKPAAAPQPAAPQPATPKRTEPAPAPVAAAPVEARREPAPPAEPAASPETAKAAPAKKPAVARKPPATKTEPAPKAAAAKPPAAKKPTPTANAEAAPAKPAAPKAAAKKPAAPKTAAPKTAPPKTASRKPAAKKPSSTT